MALEKKVLMYYVVSGSVDPQIRTKRQKVTDP